MENNCVTGLPNLFSKSRVSVRSSTKIAVLICLVAVVCLFLGGVLGFVAGVGSTQAGKEAFAAMVAQEQWADVATPQTLTRQAFQLQYPGNWTIDTKDDSYDPDHYFTIESPGAAIVLFFLDLKTDPAEALQDQIDAFQDLLGTPTITRFQQYGSYTGDGAVMKGTIYGIRTTVTIVALDQNGKTILIVQQCPDEDLKYVQEGQALIENSFSLTPGAGVETQSTGP